MDSKLLSRERREELAPQIKQQAAAIGIGWVPAKVIDQIGMTLALKRAAGLALAQIHVPYEQIIVDGTIMLVEHPLAVTLKKADQLIQAVSAAAIVAKVTRDSYMRQIDAIFPGYGFVSHVGYATVAHRKILAEKGGSPIHRYSFAPLEPGPRVTKNGIKIISTGQRAERIAANHLLELGYEIIRQNWKTKWCEVDIVAQKDGIVHLVEVKYRRTARQGSGLEYITFKKRRQMQFAAKLWQAQQEITRSIQLAALEVSGAKFAVSAWLANIDAA